MVFMVWNFDYPRKEDKERALSHLFAISCSRRSLSPPVNVIILQDYLNSTAQKDLSIPLNLLFTYREFFFRNEIKLILTRTGFIKLIHVFNELEKREIGNSTNKNMLEVIFSQKRQEAKTSFPEIEACFLAGIFNKLQCGEDEKKGILHFLLKNGVKLHLIQYLCLQPNSKWIIPIYQYAHILFLQPNSLEHLAPGASAFNVFFLLSERLMLV